MSESSDFPSGLVMLLSTAGLGRWAGGAFPVVAKGTTPATATRAPTLHLSQETFTSLHERLKRADVFTPSADAAVDIICGCSVSSRRLLISGVARCCV